MQLQDATNPVETMKLDYLPIITGDVVMESPAVALEECHEMSYDFESQSLRCERQISSKSYLVPNCSVAAAREYCQANVSSCTDDTNAT